MADADDLEWEVIPAESKPKDPRLEAIENKFLPKLPATFLLLGSCGSGKSSILWTLLTKGYMHGKKRKKSVFDELVVYLGTLDAVDSFEQLPIENRAILQDFSPEDFEEYLEDLKQHQMKKLEEGEPPLNTCIVFDDFAGANLMRKTAPNKAPPLEKLCLTSRHECNATIFYLSQVYKKSGFSVPSVRNNITVFVVSRMNRGELFKVAEELSDDYEADEWLAIYDRIMAKRPYNFVTFDVRRPFAEGRWRERFHIPFPKSRKRLELEKQNSTHEDKDEA